MKRPLLIIAVFLLLGAVVNVAVAWGCVLLANYVWSYKTWAATNPEHTTPSGWQRSVPASWPEVPTFRRTYEGKWFRAVADFYSPQDRTLDAYVLSEWQIGVPAKSLSYDTYTHHEWKGGPMSRRRLHAMPAPPEKSWSLAFPAHPIWPAFIANTLFYAALLWLLIPGPFVLRRFLRVRRGLCPKCAYPMGESSVCTECGCGLPKRARTA